MKNAAWRTISLALGVVLVGSNFYWIFALLDAATVAKARDQQQFEMCHALRQCLEIAPRIAKVSPMTDIIDYARATTDSEPFEKDGFLWAGFLGFSIDSNGRLLAAAPGWEPFQCEE